MSDPRIEQVRAAGDATRRRWTPRAVLSYAWSWCRADLVGYVVCSWRGHARPNDSDLRFQRFLNNLYRHPLDSDVWDIICPRCGDSIGTLAPNPTTEER